MLSLLGRIGSLTDLDKRVKQLTQKYDILNTDCQKLADDEKTANKQFRAASKKCVDLKKQITSVQTKATALKVDSKIDDFDEKRKVHLDDLETIMTKVDDWIEKLKTDDDSKSDTKSTKSEVDVDGEMETVDLGEPPVIGGDESAEEEHGKDRAIVDQEESPKTEEPEISSKDKPSTTVDTASSSKTTKSPTDAKKKTPVAKERSGAPRTPSKIVPSKNDKQQRDKPAADEVTNSNHPKFTVIHNVQGVRSGDLTVKQNDSVEVLATRSDGWWRVRTSTGSTGLVPSSALQPADGTPYEAIVDDGHHDSDSSVVDSEREKVEREKVEREKVEKEKLEKEKQKKQDEADATPKAAPKKMQPLKDDVKEKPKTKDIPADQPSSSVPDTSVKESIKQSIRDTRKTAPQKAPAKPGPVAKTPKRTSPPHERAIDVAQKEQPPSPVESDRSHASSEEKITPPISTVGQMPKRSIRPSVTGLQVPQPPVLTIPQLDNLPTGFIMSPLAALQEMDPHVSLECHLAPRLSESNLAFHDLYQTTNDSTAKLRLRKTRVSKCMRVSRCDHMPSTASLNGYAVLGRYVRMCLFDGRQVLSNVHVMRVMWDEKKPHVWTFGDKLTEQSHIIEHGDIVVRSNYPRADVKLLLEFGIAVNKVGSTPPAHGHLSCGWTTIELMTTDAARQHQQDIIDGHMPNIGEQMSNKQLTLTLRSGSPFDATVGIAPGTPSKNSPHVIVKPYSAVPALVELIDTLPDQLIWHTPLIPWISYYRRILAHRLLSQNICTSLLPSPFVATFPRVMQYDDIVDVVRRAWEVKVKTIDKKIAAEEMAQEFRQVFIDTAFALDQVQMPKYSLSDFDALQKRKHHCDAFANSHATDKSSFRWLSGQAGVEIKYKPLDIFSHCVNVVGIHAID